MKRIHLIIKSGILITIIVVIGLPALSEAPSNPNIIIILADDLGYGDLQCYNSESLVPTPNLDKLASEGIRLTDAYCPVSVCSPTRYSLMTGRYSFRSRKPSGVMANYEPSMMASEILILPEMLREAGYTTAGFGKWHLGTKFPTLDGDKPVGYGKFYAENNGANLDMSKPVSDGPLDHGFDHWLGFSCASECWILEDKMVIGALEHDLYTTEAAQNTNHLKSLPLDEYLQFITDRAIQFLVQQAPKPADQPFFLYYSPYVPHVPLAVSKQFQGSTKAGLYGDYVHELDHHVGMLLNTLDNLNLAKNTIVLFASDNGSQFKITSSEMDMAEADNTSQKDLSDEQFENIHHPNGRLKGTKWTIYEGGVRTPLIARWPGHFRAGAVNDQLFALNDVIATLAGVIGYNLPEHSAQDSYNLLPVLKGEDKSIREMVVVQSSSNVLGLRWGNWKYIGGGDDYKPENPDDPEGELYDLSVDESESMNLYEKQPDMVAKMKRKLQEILSGERSTIQ